MTVEEHLRADIKVDRVGRLEYGRQAGGAAGRPAGASPVANKKVEERREMRTSAASTLPPPWFVVGRLRE